MAGAWHTGQSDEWGLVFDTCSSAKFYEPHSRFLAHHGVVVVTPEFTNSTEAPFPAGLNDCYAALEWTLGNLASLGGSSKVRLRVVDALCLTC
jgi:hypothetical protein